LAPPTPSPPNYPPPLSPLPAVIQTPIMPKPFKLIEGPPKHYTIITYDKCIDKLKREKKILNYEQKILKCFYPTQFEVENYQKGTEEYKH
jgi:hypothetical protein